MLLYLSESDKFTFEPFGMGIMLAQINDGGQNPLKIIDVYNTLKYGNNNSVPCIKLFEYTKPLSLTLSDFNLPIALITSELLITWQCVHSLPYISHCLYNNFLLPGQCWLSISCAQLLNISPVLLNKRSYLSLNKLAILEPPSTPSTTFVQLKLFYEWHGRLSNNMSYQI